MRCVKVGDVLEFRRRPVEINSSTEYTLIGVYSFGKGIFHREPQLGIDLGDYTYSLVLPGDLVLSNIQAWEGAIGLATEAELNTVGTHRFLSYTAYNPDEIDTNWARYFFLSPVGLPLIQKAAPGSVTRNRTLARERFEEIEIPLPNIDKQRGVARHLDRVASTTLSIEQRRQAVRTRIEAFYASIAAQSHLTVQERETAGWRYLPLSEVMTEASKTVEVKFDEEYPNLGIYSFGRGIFEKPPISGLETSAKKLNRVQSGQFIYSRLFAFEGAYAYVPYDFDGYFVSNEFPSFDVDPDLGIAEFIAAALRSPLQWQELANSSKGLGVRRQRVKAEALLAHKLWFPPVPKQHRIVSGLRKLSQVNELMSGSDIHVGAVLRSALNQAFADLE